MIIDISECIMTKVSNYIMSLKYKLLYQHSNNMKLDVVLKQILDISFMEHKPLCTLNIIIFI